MIAPPEARYRPNGKITETNRWFTLNATRMAGESGIVGMWQWPGGALIVTIRPDNTFTAGPISGRWQAANLGDRTYHVDLAAADSYRDAGPRWTEVLRRRPVRESVRRKKGIVSGRRISRDGSQPIKARCRTSVIQWYRDVAVYDYQHPAVGGRLSRPHAARRAPRRAPGVARPRGSRRVSRPSPAAGRQRDDASSGSGGCARRQHAVRADR